MFKSILLTAGSILIMTMTGTQTAQAADGTTLQLDLSTGGPVMIALKPDLAPKHVARLKELTNEGFYNGVVFHRVIDGFMAQTGDPTGTGTGGSSKPDLQAEFSDANYTRGTVGMARTSNPNSANSQFFICFNDCSFLNKQYTVVGQVTQGMEFVDKLAKGEPPASPDKIVKAQIVANTPVAAGAAPAGEAKSSPAESAKAPAAAASPASETAPAPATPPAAAETRASATVPAAGDETAPPAADAKH